MGEARSAASPNRSGEDDAPASSRPGRRRRTRAGTTPPAVKARCTAGALAAALLLASCSAATQPQGTASQHPKSGHDAGTTGTGTRTTGTTGTTNTTTTTLAPTPTTTDQPGWTPAATADTHVAIDQRTIEGPAGGSITVFRFRADRVHYDLHVGSTDPPTGTAVVGPNAGSAIGAQEAPLVLAAFNGGFKANAGAGGFELNGQVLEPLVAGDASLVIDQNGAAHIGVWGQTVPAPGEQVASVRQNLAPLVAGGQPSAQIGDLAAWGSTLNGATSTPRSALGQDAQGNLLYAAGMSVLPSDLADALVSAGAVNAMELDINPEWVQLAYAATPGAALTTGIPGQNRPADQYQVGWSRDFVVVLAGRPA